jgi:hypothetical protein
MRKFELKKIQYGLGQKFYAQSHCAVCGSTFGSGEWLPTIHAAVEAARDGIEAHELRYGHGKRSLLSLLFGGWRSVPQDPYDDERGGPG